MQNSSIRCSSLAKSTQDQTMDFSLPVCSWTLVPGMMMWLLRTFSVFSCLNRNRMRWLALCCSTRAWPIPRSFHSLASASKRYSLDLLQRGSEG